MKAKKKWLIFWAAIITTVITTAGVIWANSGSSNKQKNRQVNTSGDNISPTGDSKKTGRDNNEAGRDVNVTNVYGDTSHNKVQPPVSISSVNQTGGITAQYVFVLTAELLDTKNGKTSIKLKENYECTVDTAIHVITFKPKVGAWDNTFIGIPDNEKHFVQPHFANKSGNIISGPATTHDFESMKLFGISSIKTPASSSLSYSIKYKTMPSYLVFGDLDKVLYKVDLKKAFKTI